MMKQGLYIVLLLMLLSPAAVAKTPQRGGESGVQMSERVGEQKREKGGMSRAKLEAQLQKQPSIEGYDQLAVLLLQEGDTASAEERLRYALKLHPGSPILLYRQATIAAGKGRANDSGKLLSEALLQGLEPAGKDSAEMVQLMLQSADIIRTRMQMAQQKDKRLTTPARTLGLLALLQNDSTRALEHYNIALHRGDTTLRSTVTALAATIRQSDTIRAQKDTVLLRIPFKRENYKTYLTAELNGLRMKLHIDTTATECSISGVESAFMLKNDYVSNDDLVDRHIVVLKTVDLGNGVVMKNIRLYNHNGQEQSVVINLQFFRPLGEARINDQENVIEIYEKVY